MKKGSQKGLTTAAVLLAGAVLAISATLLGKITYSLIRSRLRAESKAALINSKDTLIELILHRMAQVLEASCPGDAATFQTSFNSSSIDFSGQWRNPFSCLRQHFRSSE